jgi:hypothetical protein
MHEREGVCELNPVGDVLEQMGLALHDLCQPLTTLQCRLEIAGLVGTAEAYREAVDLGLVECGRLMEGVHLLREILQASRQVEDHVNRPALAQV